MDALTSIGILLVAISFFIIAVVLVSARLSSRNQQLREEDDSPVPVNLASINDAVIVARMGGQVTYINPVAAQWFGLQGSDPDLWLLSQRVVPAEAFLELFASEGQAVFVVGERSLEASSHRVAMGEEAQFIVVLREETPLPTLERADRGSAKALQVLSEIGQAINTPLELDATLHASLEGIGRLVAHDAAQITLWDQETETLRPVIRSGPAAFVSAADDPTALYRIGEGYTGWIAQRRRALLVENVQAELEIDRAARPTDPQIGSYVGVPLTVRNRFIGTMEIMSEEVDYFDREDLAVLNLIAEQAAIAIENARRYSSQAERVAELSGLQKIAEAISVLQDPYQLFAQLSQRVAELMSTEMAGVLLWDRDQERLTAQRPIHGVADSVSRLYDIPLERGSPARSLWEDVSFWYSNDVVDDHLVQEMGLGALAEMAGTRTTAMATMTVGEEKIGVLQVANKQNGNPFTLEDIRLLQIYANQASIVVESGRLYGQEQSRVAELEGLQQISQAMSVFTDPEELYGQLTRRIAELIGVDICGVLMYEPTNEALVARVPFYGVRREVVEGFQIPVGKRGLAREVWREYDLFTTNFATTDDQLDRIGIREVVRDAAVQTLMLAPLSTGGRRFGMLVVANKTNRTDFDDDDRRLVAIFASQAAALIDNARLYQDTDATLRKRAAELRSVSRISQELNATLELERILEVIAGEAQLAEGADYANLVMFDWHDEGSEIIRDMTFGEELGEEAAILEMACARSGEVIEITDFEKVPSYPSPKEGTRSALIVPIHFEGQVVGVIGLYSYAPGGLGQSAREYAQAVSAQATAAVTNATRHAEQMERSELLRRRAEQLAQIFELGRMFRSDQSLESNLTSVARAIRESVGFSRVVISVKDPERSEVSPVAHYGLSDSAFSLIMGEAVQWELASNLIKPEYRVSGSYLVPGPRAVPLAVSLGMGATRLYRDDVSDSSQITGDWQTGALLIVPLYATTEDILGILVADKPLDGRVPTRNSIELLEIFGNQAAYIIENSRLYRSAEERAEQLTRSLEDLERSYNELDKLSHEMIRKDAELSQANELLNLRAQRLLALHRIMESVDTTREPVEVLGAISEAVVQEMDIDQCIVMMADNGGPLRTVAASGKVPGLKVIDDLIGEEDPVYRAYTNDEAVLVVPGKRRSTATARLMRGVKSQTLVATPLHIEGIKRGVLVIGTTRPGAAFGDEDRDLFNLLASQIAVEYENAQLYGAVQTEAATAASERDRLQQLHLITTALQQTSSLEERLAVVARGIKSVGWGRVAVALIDDDQVSHMATAGYDNDSEERTAIERSRIWEDRYEQELMSMRVGSSYYLAHDHPWVRRRMGGSNGVTATGPLGSAQNGGRTRWHPDDQLYLPMFSGTDVIGVVSLRDPVTGERPTEAGLRPLELFVQQASSAIENARLYQETLALQSYNESLVQSIQQGIIVLDGKLNVESVNAYIKTEYDWEERYLGASLFDWRPDFRDIGISESVLEAVSNGRPAEMPNLTMRRGPETQVLNAYAYPRYDEDGDVTGVVLLIEDITQRARLEADIARRGQQLAALSEVSRSITANLSVPDVVASAIAQAEEVLSYDRLGLWMQSFDEDDTLELAASSGFREEPPRLLRITEDPSLSEVVSQQLSVLVMDRDADPRYPEQNVYRTWLGVPMISGGNMIGVLTFEAANPNELAPADEQVAAAYANQVGVALENARLFEEVTENATELSARTQRLALLNRISSTIGQSLDQTSILQTAIGEITRGLDADHGDVFMFNRDSERAELSIQYPSNPDGTVADVSFPMRDNPLVAQLRAEKKPIPVEDVHNDPIMTEARESFADRGFVSSLLIPLVVGNSPIGVIAVNYSEPHSFQPEQVELAQTVTNQVAISVQNAQLFTETVARQRELGILVETGQIAASTLDLTTVANSAAAHFNRSLDVDGTAIYLWNQNTNTLNVLADVDRHGVNGSTALDLKHYPAVRSVVIEQGVVVLSRRNAALSEAEAAYLEARGIESVLLLPIVAREDTIGLAELRTRSEERVFPQPEIRLIRALVGSVGTAMENARLHDETQQRLTELATINDISRALTQTISTEDLFGNLQTQLERVLGVRSLTVAQVDQVANKLTFPLVVREGERVELEPRPFGEDLYSRVVETRQPLNLQGGVAEYAESHGMGGHHQDVACILCMPLQSGEKVIGVLALEDYRVYDSFGEATLRVLNPIAAQVAVSLENTRLYGELEKRLSETTTLQEVSRMVNSALDLQEIFDRVVNELAEAFEYPLIGLFTLEGRELILQASHGLTDDETQRLELVPVEQGIVGRTVQTGEGIFVPDVHQDPDYIGTADWVTSLVAVPIISDEFVLGVLMVQSGEERPLGENDLTLLKTFAGQVATAMVNASLYTQMVELSEELERRVEERTQELREERDRIDTLFRITVELTASLDLDRVLNRALQLVGEAIGAEYGALFLADPQSELLIYRAAMQESEIIPPGGRQIQLRRNEGMAGWVMDNRKSIIVGNVQEDPRWANVPGTEERRSLLGAPLVSSEAVLGCLFFSSDAEEAFNQGHLQLVEAAANQVATAINNAELYRLIRDQAERLGVMLRSQQTEAAKSQAILESIADGVMVSDSTGEIILFNAAAERILDLRREEVLGRPSNDLTGLYGTGAQAWTDMLTMLSADPDQLESGEFINAQIEIGSKFVSVSVAPVMHGEEYLGLVSVFRDITREVAADRAKSEFVANVSHELRTPMTSIKGYADLLLLQAAGEINDDQRRFLEVIKNNADRLTSLVNDLLTISSIEQRDIDLDIRPVEVAEVVGDVVLSLEGQMNTASKEIAVDWAIPEELPPIEGDYDRIHQIVQNLVSNAYQYTMDGGEIAISAEQNGEGVTIHVADTGIGIPYENQKRIFERFYRGVENPVVMATSGTGLGLSIVQHLVEMHRGSITFQSEPGVGTTFSVWLPFEFRQEDIGA